MNVNLPMKKENNGLLSMSQKRRLNKGLGGIKKLGKLGLNGLKGVGGLAIMEFGGASANPFIVGLGLTIGYSAFGSSLRSSMNEILYKRSKDMLFASRRKINGEISLEQIIDSKLLYKLRKYSPMEKAAVMGLQTLVGLQKFKQEFDDSNKKKAVSRDGKNNVYKKMFSTTTHGINIKTFKALEKLGYIEIQSLEDVHKSYLVLERVSFGQFKDAKDALMEKISSPFEKDKNSTHEYQKQMQKLKFMLTDKPIDLDEMYKEYKNNSKDKNMRRIGMVIEALRDKNVDISIDKLGIPSINYKSQKSLASRVDEMIKEENGNLDENVKDRFKKENKDLVRTTDETIIVENKRVEVESIKNKGLKDLSLDKSKKR